MTTKIFYKNGFLYELVKAGKKALIYKQSLNDKIIAYEVHRIRLRKKRVLWGLLLNNFIRRPSDNDFGTRAWSYFNYERALRKFSNLEHVNTKKN